MLLSIVLYFMISGICFFAGYFFYQLAGVVSKTQKSVIHYMVSGMILLTALAQYIVLFAKVTLLTCLWLLAALLFYWVMRRKKYVSLNVIALGVLNRKAIFICCVFAFTLSILIINSGPVMMDDTGSYHIQMIKWIQEYGTVPGIANLHMRFGFNSSWFTSIALFSYPLKGCNTYGALNGLLSIWLCFFILEKIFLALKSERRDRHGLALAYLVLLVLCLLNWPMLRGSASNSNYDFVTAACIVVLLGDLFLGGNEIPAEWLIWPAYLFTVRIINFPLLILSAAFIFHLLKKEKYGLACKSIIFVIFIIAPFLVRNLILSGYLFFPAYQLDFFGFDWRVDKQKLVEILNYIKYFNRVNPMFQPIAVTQNISGYRWIPDWFLYLFRFDKIIVVVSLIGYGRLLLTIGRKKHFLLNTFMFAMICQLIFWFFSAPDPRFVYGPLLFGVFAAFKIVLPWPSIVVQHRFLLKSVFAISIFTLIFSIAKILRNEDYRNYLIPHVLPAPSLRTFLVGSIPLHIPDKILDNWNPRCYGSELPCLYIIDPRLESRGKTIEAGFRINRNVPYIFKGGEYKIQD